jgi:hypothetical protein
VERTTSWRSDNPSEAHSTCFLPVFVLVLRFFDDSLLPALATITVEKACLAASCLCRPKRWLPDAKLPLQPVLRLNYQRPDSSSSHEGNQQTRRPSLNHSEKLHRNRPPPKSRRNRKPRHNLKLLLLLRKASGDNIKRPWPKLVAIRLMTSTTSSRASSRKLQRPRRNARWRMHQSPNRRRPRRPGKHWLRRKPPKRPRELLLLLQVRVFIKLGQNSFQRAEYIILDDSDSDGATLVQRPEQDASRYSIKSKSKTSKSKAPASNVVVIDDENDSSDSSVVEVVVTVPKRKTSTSTRRDYWLAKGSQMAAEDVEVA